MIFSCLCNCFDNYLKSETLVLKPISINACYLSNVSKFGAFINIAVVLI